MCAIAGPSSKKKGGLSRPPSRTRSELLPGGRRHCGATIRSGAPFGMLLVGPAHEPHVGIAEPLGNRPHFAVAERKSIDRRDGRQLVARPTEERFVREVDLRAVDL